MKDFLLNKQFSIPISTKSISTEKRIIIGYASTSGNKDRHGDVITEEALKNSKNDLMKNGSKTVLYNHDREKPIGQVTKTELDRKGLKVTIQISKAKDVDDIWTKIQEGTLNSFSIGGRFKKVEPIRDDDGNVIEWQIKKMELYEVSVVSIPANAEASIEEVITKSLKSFEKEKKMKKVKKDKVEEKVVVKAEKKEEKKIEPEKKIEKKEEKPVVKHASKNFVKKLVSESENRTVDLLKKLDEKLSGFFKTYEKDSRLNKKTRIAVKGIMNKSEETRKGFHIEEDVEEVENDEPVKVLKDENDKETIEYVKYVMDNSDVYKKLGDEEKNMARAIYFKILEKKARVDRQ